MTLGPLTSDKQPINSWRRYERMSILSFKEAQLSPLLRHPADDLQKGLRADLLGTDRKMLRRVIGRPECSHTIQTKLQTNLALNPCFRLVSSIFPKQLPKLLLQQPDCGIQSCYQPNRLFCLRRSSHICGRLQLDSLTLTLRLFWSP